MPRRHDDAFWFDLTLRHPDADPDGFTSALGISPRHSARAGSTIGSNTRKATVWIATLSEGRGEGDDAFSEGLRVVVERLAGWEDFLRAFSVSGGQSWLTINHVIAFDSGVLSEISLEPAFLSRLEKCDLALVMRGWSSENWLELDVLSGALRNPDFDG